MKDVISGKYLIYYKGEFIDASQADCEGLEKASVSDENHILDRLMGDNILN
ncbi:hypothetical protein GCM10007140_24530 [Priestia taiwanensis]|uniref:Uncharacterized protein n=1 Tax=Priestia taiwanensis TaxID=1347902 RepID=A0A917ES68_9BACI|nr:hypothetical protein GCM10007140_24530 [Priestia taiwanensis]